MFKLIKLEIKKYKLFNYWKGVLLANIGFIACLLMIYTLEKLDENIPFEDFEMVTLIMSSTIRATFVIFASVLIVKLVIDEYRNKSINIMFTYPIKRKQIMLSKLTIIVAFTFLTVMLSTVFMNGLVYVIDLFFDLIPGEIKIEALAQSIVTAFFHALATAGLSLIPLLFGMPRKSAPATIVSSIFLVSLTSSTSDNFTLFSVIAVPISLGVFGLIIGYLSIRNIEKIDVKVS